MKYSININQKAVKDNNLDLDIIDCAILDFLIGFSVSNKVVKIIYENETYCWFSHSNIQEQLPILDLKKDTVYRRLKSLCEKGFIRQNPNNQELGRSYYNITELALLLVFSDERATSDKNPKVSDENPKPSDKNPNDKYIIKEYNETNNTSSKKEEGIARPLKKESKRFVPPTLEEVKCFFKEKGYTEESAKTAFEYYDIADWKDSKGQKVKNWKQKMFSVWMKPENKLKESETQRIIEF